MTRTARAALEGYEFFGAEASADYPEWVPPAARYYLAHTEKGRTIRDLAREAQVHPSTVLRQVRRMEAGQDDPLVDSALRQISGGQPTAKDHEAALAREALPVLRRLVEPEAVLAVARDMDKGVIAQELAGRDPRRLAVVDRRLAEAMALRDWITCPEDTGRIRRYRITAIGRTELKRLGAEPELRGLAEAPTPFLHDDGEAEDDPRLRHMRSAMSESPLLQLSRRKDDKGRPFLNAEQVKAGERLREDYELAMRSAGADTDWAAWLARLPDLSHVEDREVGTPSGAGRLRVERALADLGPGLADVALCCCCLTEGLEVFERRMGWSARSGKVVLRIALGRLHQHYRAEAERNGGLIG
jgi:DNA-binding MarR family transcriptional regulator